MTQCLSEVCIFNEHNMEPFALELGCKHIFFYFIFLKVFSKVHSLYFDDRKEKQYSRCLC